MRVEEDAVPAARVDDARSPPEPADFPDRRCFRRERGGAGGKLRELRFELDCEAVRIPYWLAPGQRIVLLTVFRRTRMREAAEVERAHQAQKVCEAERHAQHTYERRKES
ncbi:hypothetical protein [Streptomyces sp. SM1]|uniref:hypothetical protein n=1 Tax=Streptomyces sp. SM1 TaxID=402229 RepID=UPI0021564B18|nr:hypothetical protein [Streptomyces sp. SM1]